MPASIQTTLLDSPGGSPVVGAPVLVGVSRDDLRGGYQVQLDSVDVHTTYEWTLEFIPDSPDGTASTATVDLAADGLFTIVDATNMADGDHIDIGGVSLTAKLAAPGIDEFLIVPGDNVTTASNAAAAINAGGSSFNGLVTATPNGNVANLLAASTGSAGNSITLTVTTLNPGVVTVSGPTLLNGSDANSKVALFNVDHEGPYLVKLVVDKTLGTEDTQYVRLRFVTRFADLTLVAGGERRDATGIVPVDVDDDGWSQEQNINIQKLLGFVRRSSTSGRVLFVDANRGRDRTNTPNDTSVSIQFPGSDESDPDGSGFTTDSEGFADFSSIQAAIDYAAAAAGRGEPAPSVDDPYIICVQPGLYEEDVALEPFVHVQGLNPTPLEISGFFQTNYVCIKGLATFAPATPTDICQIQGLTFSNDDAVTLEPVFKQSGGILVSKTCAFRQEATALTQGPALLVDGTAFGSIHMGSVFESDASGNDGRYVVIADHDGLFLMEGGSAKGRSVLLLNPSLNTSFQCNLEKGAVVDAGSGYGIRGCAKQLNLLNASVSATLPDKEMVLDGDGAGAGTFATSFQLRITRSWLQGHIIYHEDIATGLTRVVLNSVNFESTGDPDLIQFPTGNPDEFLTEAGSQTIRYDPDYTDPLTGLVAVPPADQLTADNVQNAIDELVLRVVAASSSTTVDVDAGPSYTVLADDDYIGVDTVTPATTIDIILPNTIAGGAIDGRRLTIKDEGGGAGVGGQEINVYAGGATSTIDGVIRAVGTPLVMNTNFDSINLICRGASGTTATWFLV
jgi:hypothetical protein